VLGMLYIGGTVSRLVPGGAAAVISHAATEGRFHMLPALELKDILLFFTAWITMMLGSIPQQDVFQRVQSAKTEKIAVWASVAGGVLYFIFAFVPMFLAYSATLIDPHMVAGYLSANDPKATQRILPELVLTHAPLFAQVMFFGALLSAIKSCASATLLAPSVTFSENILKPMIAHRISDRGMLHLMRGVTVSFTILVTLYAMQSKTGIFGMVEDAYQITLVMAFVPLVAGVYWKRATRQGALVSIFCGLAVWLGISIFGSDDPYVPAHFAGMFASMFGMIAGSLAPNLLGSALPEEPAHAALHHRAASHTEHVAEGVRHHPNP